MPNPRRWVSYVQTVTSVAGSRRAFGVLSRWEAGSRTNTNTEMFPSKEEFSAHSANRQMVGGRVGPVAEGSGEQRGHPTADDGDRNQTIIPNGITARKSPPRPTVPHGAQRRKARPALQRAHRPNRFARALFEKGSGQRETR